MTLPEQLGTARLARLVALKGRLDRGEIPTTLSFSDKHGRAADLQRIVERARESARTGTELRIVGHGDSFDRGDDNVEVFELLRELIGIASACSNVRVDLLWGNHDLMLLEAVVLGGVGNMEMWCAQGGARVMEDCERAGLDVREIGRFMLEFFQLLHVDAMEFLHVHALCPPDGEGTPECTGAEMKRLQDRWSSVQTEVRDNPSAIEVPEVVKRVRGVLNDAEAWIWTRTRDWAAEFRGDLPLRIDETNKRKLLSLLREMFRDRTVHARTERKGSRLSSGEMDDVNALVRDLVDQSWQEMLLEYTPAIVQAGIEFEILATRRDADKDRIDRYLACLGANGYVAGHDHHRRLVCIDGRLFGIDVEDGDAGHLICGNDGIYFDGIARNENEIVLDRTGLLRHIDEQICRLN